MKKLLFTLLASIPFYTSGQIKYNLDNNITGSYSTTKAGEQPTLLVNCTNKVSLGHLSVDLNPFYNLTYMGSKMTGNELLFRENIGYTDKNNATIFVLHQYSSSYIRNISCDNMFGLGFGKKFIINEHMNTSLSYCFLNHYRKYSEIDVHKVIRNSFRVRIKLDYTHIGFSAEYYFQPNIDDIKDINVFGTVSMSIFNSKPVNLVIQHVYNYISTDQIKNIQATTIGLRVKINNDKK